MKKVIRIKFATGLNQDLIELIENFLKDKFKINISDNDFEYYITNELMYSNQNMFLEVLNLKPEVIRICFLGEAIYPDLNLFDYAVCFDQFNNERILKFSNVNIRVGQLYDSINELDLSKQGKLSKEILKEKTKFCNFIYGNPLAHPMRDELFYKISEYKQVDSLGKHLKNVDIEDTRFNSNWAKLSVELKRPYKFTIAAENAQFKGYTTEKLITSMMANTIPIYFGNPDIAKEFNPKSFINVSDFSNLDDLVKRVKDIDENDDLYCEIMSEPWRTPEQIERIEKEYETFLNKFYNIFEQDFKSAHKRPQGCWADHFYPNFFKNILMGDAFISVFSKSREKSFLEKIFSIKKISSKKCIIIRFLGIKLIIGLK